MELNEEQVKKALDWLDSLVGNSNDSDIAMFTYQLLGILYDTCEELTEANKSLKHTISQLGKNNDELARVLPLAKKEIQVETVREMQERLRDTLKHYPERCGYCFKEKVDQIAKEMLEDNK